MTEEELRALPEGAIHHSVRVMSAEECKARGMPLGSKLRIPKLERGRVSVQGPDDLAFAVIDGQAYTFGLRSDGSWYKQAVYW